MIDELNNSLMAKSRSVLDEAAAMLQAGGLTCETHTQLGNVAEQINDAVKRLGCDTVVMAPAAWAALPGWCWARWRTG